MAIKSHNYETIDSNFRVYCFILNFGFLKFFLSLFFVLLFDIVFAQDQITVSGFIEDHESGERLINAIVYDSTSKKGVISNSYGFYSLTIPAGSSQITVSYLGYKKLSHPIQVSSNQTLNFSLISDIELSSVTIEGERDTYNDRVNINHRVSAQLIKQTPAILGEPDLMKTLQSLPGLDAGNEGTSNLHVRGGSADQNLILMDGVPIYNSNHLFGFFSIFNTDAIRSVSVFKSNFPARYAGRLSSVIDVAMKDGNNLKLSGNLEVGLISSKATLEGPLFSKNTSFIISARRTYLDLLVRPIQQLVDDNSKTVFFFHDLNAKINHRLSSKDRLFLSFYGGKDVFSFGSNEVFTTDSVIEKSETDFGVSWGNIIGSFRWNHLYNSILFSNFTATFSNYNFNFFQENIVEQEEDSEIQRLFEKRIYDSHLSDASLKWDFDYFPSSTHDIKFGASITTRAFEPGIFNQRSQTQIDTTFGAKREQGLEYSIYFQDDWELSDLWVLKLGVNATRFEFREKSLGSIQPRFSLILSPYKKIQFNFSYSEMQQFLHLLANTGVGLPTDLWVPATERAEPERARQIALDILHDRKSFAITFSVYHKSLSNLIAYKDGSSFFNNGSSWEENIEVGSGESYGLETSLEKKTGRLKGTLVYSLSSHQRKFANINGGRSFPYRFDRRHQIKLSGNYKLKDHIQFTFQWLFGTGNPVTVPVAETPILDSGLQNHLFRLADEDVGSLSDFFAGTNPNNLSIYKRRNNLRMKSFHRLDIGLSMKKEKKRGIRTWSFGIYNVYNRSNPYYIGLESSRLGTGQRLTQYSLFPIIPHFSYGWQF